MSDKILVANFAALNAKYGADGLKSIRDAAADLVAADKERGLTTQLVDISSKIAMLKFSGPAVTSPQKGAQIKNAIDAIYKSVTPDYIVILDCDDVIPHIDLKNPASADGDATVPSDLPYASDAPFSNREIKTYAAVTRVVGRIAGIRGATTPDFLIKQLKKATKFKTGKRDGYFPYFGLSAEPWQKSTSQSVKNIFSNDAIKVCPPEGTPATKLLTPLAHFINCHGGSVDPQFYGQHGENYPVSMNSDDVAKGAKPDTVVAAECCYGAQLFDPKEADGSLPISNAYLGAGAVGYFGSTTIAYGPATGNGAADLLTQFFMIDMLAGASLGRACLQARQKFVQTQKMADGVNLKTLGQFILLADPSLQPCLVETSPAVKAMAKVIGAEDYAAARKRRRIALSAFGKAAADSSAFAGKKVARFAATLHNQVRKLARQRGFRAKKFTAFKVVGGENFGKAMKARDAEPKVLMLVEQGRHRAKPEKRPKGVPPTHVFVAHTQDGHIVDVAEYINR